MPHQKSNMLQRLTDREREILLCLAQGNSYKDIAKKLGIKFNTVKNHLKHIYKKTGVSSMIQATAWYYTLLNNHPKNLLK